MSPSVKAALGLTALRRYLPQRSLQVRTFLHCIYAQFPVEISGLNILYSLKRTHEKTQIICHHLRKKVFALNFIHGNHDQGIFASHKLANIKKMFIFVFNNEL